MKKTISRNGFTLIELIIVMVILGIMAAVAVPRYLDSIENAEASAEDAVISAIQAGLKQFANNSLLTSGRAEWPENPFDALAEKPAGYKENWPKQALTDGVWTFDWLEQPGPDGAPQAAIFHQRADNSRWKWHYYQGTQGGGDNASIGTLDERTEYQLDNN